MQEGHSGFYSFISYLWSPAYHRLSAFFAPKRSAPAPKAAHPYGCYESPARSAPKSATGGP